MEKQIIKELGLLLEKMNAGSAILSIVNSYGDSLSDEDVIENLKLVTKHYTRHTAEAQIARLKEKYHLNEKGKKISDKPIFQFLPMKRKVSKEGVEVKSKSKRKQKH